MEKKSQRPWTVEARQRHLDGCRRYQKQRAQHEFLQLVCAFAREIDVDLTSVAKTLGKTDKAKLLAIVSIEPREVRLKALRDLVYAMWNDATSYQTGIDNIISDTATA